MIGKKVTLKAGPVVGIIPPPELFGLDPAGYIPRVDVDKSLRGEATSGPGSDSGDWLSIYVRNTLNDLPDAWTLVYQAQFMINAPGDKVPFTIPVVASTGKQAHGPWQVCFELAFNNPADPTIPGSVDRPGPVAQRSPNSTFNVDLYPPYGNGTTFVRPPAPIYTGTLDPSNVISLAQLAQANLTFSIPDNLSTGYGAWHSKDVLTILANFGNPVTTKEVAQTNPARLMTQTANTVTVLAAEITESGPLTITYQITDEHGNPSLVSFPSVTFNIALDPVPENLLPIIMQQAPDATDNLINIEDLKIGPTGLIPNYTNIDTTKDEFSVRYNNGVWSQWFRVVSAPITLDQRFLRPLAIADYGVTKGDKDTVIDYRIRKNGDIFPGPVTPFKVNLSVEGPSNPGDPGTVNTRLIPAEFYGTPMVPAEKNKLEFKHAGKPVIVRVEIWQTTDPTELPGPRKFLIARDKNGVLIGPAHELNNGEVSGGYTTWEISWDDFAKFGNTIVDFDYVVSPTATPTSTTNLNPARPTPVEFSGAITTPLPAAQFVGATTGQFGVWNCASIVAQPPKNFEGKVFVPGNPKMLGALRLAIRLFRPRSGPPFLFDKTETYEVTVNQAIRDNGYTFPIPYKGFFELAQTGRGEVVYTVPLDDGTEGRGTAEMNVRSTLFYTLCDNVTPITVP